VKRVTPQGPNDVSAQYFKPPEPPIFVGTVHRDRSRVEIFCPSCFADLHPRPIQFLSRHARVINLAILEPRVTLEWGAYSQSVRREDGSGCDRDVEAFVGQCGRCQRIYIANVTPPRS
jgi:hypothetical protein